MLDILPASYKVETKNFSRLRTEENEAQRVVGEIDRFVVAVRLIKRRNRRNAIRIRLETEILIISIASNDAARHSSYLKR